jgi:predicted phosphoribosyltransferase
MFRDRADAGRQLAQQLQGRVFREPLVLAIPRGGVVVGAALAEGLGADLDVVLARKLRAPEEPELAIGAMAEGGQVYLHPEAEDALLLHEAYLGEERQRRLAEIAWLRERLRGSRPPAPVAGRSVIITDDGIATGSTMIAALQAARVQGPAELLVAVPVADPEALLAVRHWCDDALALVRPESLLAIGQFYDDFTQVDEAQAADLLRSFAVARERHPALEQTGKLS